MVARSHLDFETMKFEADANLMNFDNVFNNYVNIDDIEDTSKTRTFKAGTKNAKRAVVW